MNADPFRKTNMVDQLVERDKHRSKGTNRKYILSSVALSLKIGNSWDRLSASIISEGTENQIELGKH